MKLLEPLQVPWMVAPTLSRIRMNSQEGGALEIRFVGFLRCEPAEDARYQTIAISFVDAHWLRRSPQHSDRAVIDEAAFDWSLVAGVLSGGESIAEWRARCASEWLRSGIAPNPCAYIVRNSDWNATEAVRYGLKHYLIVGDESSVEVLASGLRWNAEEQV